MSNAQITYKRELVINMGDFSNQKVGIALTDEPHTGETLRACYARVRQEGRELLFEEVEDAVSMSPTSVRRRAFAAINIDLDALVPAAPAVIAEDDYDDDEEDDYDFGEDDDEDDDDYGDDDQEEDDPVDPDAGDALPMDMDVVNEPESGADLVVEGESRDNSL